MESISSIIRTICVAGSLAICCAAQHLHASAKFTNGDKVTFSLTNFDVANSGSGNISNWNGTSVNWYVEWVRVGNEVRITYQGVLNSTLQDAHQGSSGGDAILNDGNDTTGTWKRK